MRFNSGIMTWSFDAFIFLLSAVLNLLLTHKYTKLPGLYKITWLLPEFGIQHRQDQ